MSWNWNSVELFSVIICLISQLFFCFNSALDPQIIKRRIIGDEGMPRITISGEYKQLKKLNTDFVNVAGAGGVTSGSSLRIKDPKEWKEFNVTYSSKWTNTILSHTNERYIINCSAPYLTRWKTTIVPRSLAKYGHANRYDHNPLEEQQDVSGNRGFEANSNIMFNSQIMFMIPNGTSGFLQCEGVTDSSLATKVFIFAQDGTPFVKVLQKDEFQPPIIMDTRNSFYVPCVTNYPDIIATITQITNYSDKSIGIETNISDSQIIGRYDPRKGFLLNGNNNLNQRYRCRITPSPGKKVTSSQRVTLDFYNPELNQANRATDLHFHIGSTNDEFPLGISCKSENDTLNQIKMITCNSPYECDWLNDCFYEKCTANQISRKAAIPYQRDKTNVKASGTITDPFTRGKVICVSAINPGVIAYEYLFLGLDRHRYWLSSQSQEIPKRAVIYMPETAAILYTNKPAMFACETSNFVLVSNVKFAAVFKNGSTFLLDKINASNDPAILIDHDLGFSRKEIVVKLTSNMVSIMCLAPWLNSSLWVNTSRTFEARDVQSPSIKRMGGSTNYFTFYKGDKTRSLLCNATGEPKPSIQWIVPNDVSNMFAEYKLNEATLYFPVIDSTLKGMYRCTATNEYGSDSMMFNVDVKPPSAALGTTTIIFIVLAFAVLTILLGVAVKKYFDAKKRIRDLTPEEIKEFLCGNPEVQSNDTTTDTSATESQIQSMAFNPKFEISSADLSLDAACVLGEGHFGKVILGSLRSTVVAVKTTKPCAIIDYFLALLSELKIMAYIGEDKHPNIVEFLGAVISEIEKRKVFIVVELSPLGNLHSFLVGLSPGAFLELLNEDGVISMQGRTNEQIKNGISILNFVSWCEQIANGMEFLANKRVIHGDLAARNILMFPDDVVKITDFGLSKKMYQTSLYKKNTKVALPMAWMAIESLRFREFSTQSDVWSFAVTVWEIFSLGEYPYTGIPENELVKKLLTGVRLEKPPHASQEIYAILQKCWKLDSIQRPSFLTIKSLFGDICSSLKNNFEEQSNQHTCDQNIVPTGIAANYVINVMDSAVEYVDV